MPPSDPAKVLCATNRFTENRERRIKMLIWLLVVIILVIVIVKII
jgi:predicted nucleic acid-binding Zn ribbon protein